MQLRGSSTVTTASYRQALLTALAVENGFYKNKDLFKVSQVLGQQFWLKSCEYKQAAPLPRTNQTSLQDVKFLRIQFKTLLVLKNGP